MHLYSLKSLLSFSCSSFFVFSFSYSNSAVKEYCNRICSCMNHLISLAAFSESTIRLLMSSYSVCEFHRAALCSANLLQCAMMCSAVSLIWSQEQTDDRKSGTQVLFRKAASSMWLIWICVIIELSVFCSCAWSLTALRLGGPTPRKFHPGLPVQRRFHLCSNACSADTYHEVYTSVFWGV